MSLTAEKIHFFENSTYSQEVELTKPHFVNRERRKFNVYKIEFKRKLILHYYKKGYFDSIPLSNEDKKWLSAGFSPVYNNEAREHKVFNIHHITPLNCGGMTELENLVPLPRAFHRFIHRRIINPQINGYNAGDRVVLHGLPDFNKIPLSLMCEPSFFADYVNWLEIYRGVSRDTGLKLTKHALRFLSSYKKNSRQR